MFSSTWYNFLGTNQSPIRTPQDVLHGGTGTLLGGYTGMAQGTNLSQYQQNLLGGNYSGTGMRGSPFQVATTPTYAQPRTMPTAAQQYRPPGATAAAPTQATTGAAAATATNPFDYLASQFVRPGQQMVMTQQQLSGWLQNPVVQKMLSSYFQAQKAPTKG